MTSSVDIMRRVYHGLDILIIVNSAVLSIPKLRLVTCTLIALY